MLALFLIKFKIYTSHICIGGKWPKTKLIYYVLPVNGFDLVDAQQTQNIECLRLTKYIQM